MKRYLSYYAIFMLLFFLYGCSLDIDGPVVVSVHPASGAVVEDRNIIITIRFDEAVSEATAVNAFTLSEDNGGKVNGEISVTNKILYFKPESILNGGVTFRLTVAASLEDTSGNKLGVDYYSRFQTGTNLSPPLATFLSPTNHQDGIGLTNSIMLFFDRPMDPKSARENISLSPQIDGQFNWNIATNALVFTPLSSLSPATHYTFSLKAELTDNDGVKLGTEQRLYFTTGTNFYQPGMLGLFQLGDFLPFPDRFWTNRFPEGRRDDPIVVCFDQPMDRVATESAFSLSPSVEGYFSWAEESDITNTYYQLLFHPAKPLTPGIEYTATITASAKGINGLALNGDQNLQFSVSTNYFVRITSISNSENIMLTNAKMTTITSISNTILYIRFYAFTNAPMDIVSVQDNITISRLYGGGNPGFSGGISGFNWTYGTTMLELEVDNIMSSNVYLLTIKGGSEGVNDSNDNWLQDDWEVLFRVK